MSLPPELRALCLHLSSTPVTDLPRLTPTLLRLALRCHGPLSTQQSNVAKADAPASSVVVHKLKTQLTSFLNGRSLEGRFTAVVLIKAVVEVGGYEVLKGSEPWVRGLLSILGKPDSIVVKELCIVALTKIYGMTHQYQTLLREITTPTLPAFVTSSLNLISSKSSSDIPSSLLETIFRSLGDLLPRHTTIFRPFATLIRQVVRPYLSPTFFDKISAPPSVTESARRLFILLHQTVAKGGGGEEWGKSLRELIKSAHLTADRVFRSVVEDWESVSGYNPEAVDVNNEPSGGGRSADDLPGWTGISAGAERLTGLLGFLSVYFGVETPTPVAIPIGSVIDLITRILSISTPSNLESSGAKGGPRLNPAIDRDEKDFLWSSIPQIYVAALQLVEVLAERLGEDFVPLALGLLQQVGWVFVYGRHSPQFRQQTYGITTRLLRLIGQSLNKNQTIKLFTIFRSCCSDAQGISENHGDASSSLQRNTTGLVSSQQNADTFARMTTSSDPYQSSLEPEVITAAENLLPLLFSDIPQQYLDISLRALFERTAILTHNTAAMLASILNPFVGKNGVVLPSILPHLSRANAYDATVEILLRPRMPLVPSSTVRSVYENLKEDYEQDEDMDVNFDSHQISKDHQSFSLDDVPGRPTSALPASADSPLSGAFHGTALEPHRSAFGTENPAHLPSVETLRPFLTADQRFSAGPDAGRTNQAASISNQDTIMAEEPEGSSDDESVHLTMQLDSDSDGE